MKLFKLSIIAALAFAAGVLNAAETPDCATSGTLVIATAPSLVAIPAGQPVWEQFVNNELTGFDISLACQLQRFFGIPNIQFVLFNDEAEVLNAVATGAAAIGLSHIELTAGTLGTPGVSFVKYNDSNEEDSQGVGAAINTNCCQLIQNVFALINVLAANGTLEALRTQFDIEPNTFTAAPGLIPAACAATVANLPVRNALSTFILNKFCLPVCDTSNIVNNID